VIGNTELGGFVRAGNYATSSTFQGITIQNSNDSSLAESISFIDAQNNLGVADCNIFFAHGTDGSGYMTFATTAAGSRSSDRRFERARIDGSGRLLVGTSTTPGQLGGTSPTVVFSETGTQDNLNIAKFRASSSGAGLQFNKSRGASAGTNTVVVSGDTLGLVRFSGADGTNYIEAAQIGAFVDGTPGTNDMPGRLVFSTTADGASSPTERMRIDSSGNVIINTSGSGVDVTTGTTDGFTSIGPITDLSRNNNPTLRLRRRNSDGAIQQFYRDTTIVGSISVTTIATAYNTSSDYRLKENVVPLSGAIDRLRQIPVHRFNFIADPDTVVDGFIAHEAQAIVPECVTGTKDEVDGEGSPVYQGIDQSKLVPLLTAALQETLAKIETLEARLDAAGIS
jgi:hypothetical protein